MEESKLGGLLKNLSPWEWNHLSDFVHSPFHNKNEKVMRLFQHLYQSRNHWEDADLDRATCFRVIYGNQEFDAQKLFNIQSILKRKIDEFHCLRLFRENEIESLLYLLEVQVKRRDWKAFRKTYTRFQNRLKKAEGEGKFSREYYGYNAELLRIKVELETGDHSNEAFYTAMDRLDRFYLGSSFVMACEFLNREGRLQQDGKVFADLDVLSSKISGEARSGESTPSLRMYTLIYQMLSGGEGQTAFDQCLSLLQEEGGLNITDRRDGAAYCINYCVRQVNLGHHEFQHKLFQIYDWALTEGILLEDGVLGEGHLKNFVNLAIREGKYERAKEIVNDHSPQLPGEVRDNAFDFNMATIYFAEGDLSNAKRQLIQVQFKSIFYNLDSKVLLAKIYFEEREFNALDHLLRSLSYYLHTLDSLSRNQHDLYGNFTWWIKKLVDLVDGLTHLNPKTIASKKTRLVEELNSRKNTAQFYWIRDQLQNILDS